MPLLDLVKSRRARERRCSGRGCEDVTAQRKRCNEEECWFAEHVEVDGVFVRAGKGVKAWRCCETGLRSSGGVYLCESVLGDGSDFGYAARARVGLMSQAWGGETGKECVQASSCVQITEMKRTAKRYEGECVDAIREKERPALPCGSAVFLARGSNKEGPKRKDAPRINAAAREFVAVDAVVCAQDGTSLTSDSERDARGRDRVCTRSGSRAGSLLNHVRYGETLRLERRVHQCREREGSEAACQCSSLLQLARIPVLLLPCHGLGWH